MCESKLSLNQLKHLKTLQLGFRIGHGNEFYIPYGDTGNTCVVPRAVVMAAQRESNEKIMSCTLAVVSPRCNMYKWCTAADDGPHGCGLIRNT